MKIRLLIVILVCSGFTAQAGMTTLTDTVKVNASLWDTPWGGHNTITWCHDLPESLITSGIIESASLTIDVTGVLNCDSTFNPADDHVTVSMNGLELGDLDGFVTVFDGQNLLDSLSDSMKMSATINWECNSFLDLIDGARIKTSTLSVSYDDEQAIPVVPAPSALLLGSIGAGLIGFLRKPRKT